MLPACLSSAQSASIHCTCSRSLASAGELADDQEAEQAERGVSPKSGIGRAVRYALDLREPLSDSLSDGQLSIDNSDTERDLWSQLDIGRKTWLFIDSKAAVTMATLAASASRHSLDIWHTLTTCSGV